MSTTAAGVRGALTLLAFALAATALLAGVWDLTRERAARSAHAARLALLAQVLPAHDNDPARDAWPLPAPQARRLGHAGPVPVYPARRNGTVVALALEVVAPDGYAGPIRLLVGVGRDGALLGVRVLAHRETPGLGDYIDAARSPWSSQFAGRTLGEPPEDGWAIRQDGGVFDATAGASVTPRAVVAALRRTLLVVRDHHAAWFAGRAS
ncbi:electron transport complex subunit RsxG [Chitiniphilus purpureus]|uniref:Ion-translocating oxidoreductase complex subunit G n=1 Tax=Chitiniphilus purpureus TaxID=2981137 RepID=A0ABY6DHY0_9NEIS|nr:electron transport complex subunit RsxG [Chitiniphilus sp. CD1]UXY13637.1 electron transport complex subunit RsxG [Chitiniphilus sp. CD1]